MDLSSRQLIKDVFDRVVALPAEERPSFLDRECKADPAIRAEVESMLRHDDGGDDDTDFREAVMRAAGALHEEPGVQGDRLGPYLLVRELGRGGMGTVWLAVRSDDEYRKNVAIKLLRAAAGENLRSRFLRERQILATLEHPNIARLLDGGTTDEGVPYVVMEYIEGAPIDTYCRQKSLPVEERSRLVRTVCAAVQFAHQNLIVHRDIKPGNILVDEGGDPKLLDFGIAKLLDGAIDLGAAETQTGMNLLTLKYASPEQVRAQKITTASDVYSLGVLLYELLAGRSPYDDRGDDVVGMTRAICVDDPPLPSAVLQQTSSLSARAVAGDLDNIVLKAMDKDPARRYRSAGELGEDLERHRKKLPIEARPATLRYQLGRFCSRHRFGVTAAVVMVLALIVATIFSAVQMRRAISASEQMGRERLTAITQAHRATLEAATAHLDARRPRVALRMIESVPTEQRDWTWRHIANLLDRSIARLDVRKPVAIGIDADGGRVVTVDRDGTVTWWNTFAGEAMRRLELDRSVRVARFGANATLLVAAHADAGKNLALWKLDETADAQELASHDLADPPIDVAISADGSRYAAVTNTRLRTWSTTSSHNSEWRHSVAPGSISLSSDGAYLTLVGEDRAGRVFDVSAGQPLDTVGSAATARISPDNMLVAEGRTGGGVKLRDLTTGRSVTQFLGHDGAVSSLAFDPFGTWLVSGSEDRTVRLWDTRMLFEPTIFSGHSTAVCDVAFSGDGERFVSLSDDGEARLWELEAEPSRLILRGYPQVPLGLAYSPGSSRLVLGSARGHLSFWDSESLELYDRIALPPYSMSAFAASPDDRWFATAHQTRVVLRSADDCDSGRDLPAAITELVDLTFSPDSTRLAALDATGRVILWDVGDASLVRELPASERSVYGETIFSADGSRLTSTHEGLAHVWDTASGEPVCSMSLDGRVAHGLALSPGGEQLAIGWSDGIVRVYTADTCTPLVTLAGQTAPVYSLAYTPDGSRLASGASDGTIALRDTETGLLLYLFRSAGPMYDLVFSQDGDTLFSAEDGVRVRSAKPVREMWARSILGRPGADEGRRLFDSLFDEPTEVNRALARIRAEKDLPRDVRRAALRLALEPPIVDTQGHAPADNVALSFPGDESRVVFEGTADLSMGEHFTVEAWVRPAPQTAPWGRNVTAAGGWHDAARYVVTKEGEFLVALSHEGEIGWFVFTEQGWTPAMTTRHRAPANRWTHLALVRDGTAIRILVNGYVIQEQVIPDVGPQPNLREPLVVGGRLRSATAFKGAIDQVRVWDVARSAEDVRDAMSRHLTASAPGLRAAWRFAERSGDVARDTLGERLGRLIEAQWIEE